MSFTPTPDRREDPPVKDEPGVMLIGGGHSQRIWAIAKWVLAISIIGGVMIVLFVRFGATILWAMVLVDFVLGYMAIMARWAGGDHDRRW